MRDRNIDREFDIREAKFQYNAITTLGNSIIKMETEVKSLDKEIYKLKKGKKKGKELKNLISTKLDFAVNLCWQIIREKKSVVETLASQLKALRLKSTFELQERKDLQAELNALSTELEQEFLKLQNLKNQKKK